MSTENVCACGEPTRDYFCHRCGDRLNKALGDVPWLTEELEVTVSRQKGVDYRSVGGGKGGKKANEMPSPVVWSASEARSHLKAMLVTWALFCQDEHIRHQSPSAVLPADNMPALSRYLMWRVDGLALHDIGPDAVEELTTAVTACHRVIDRPADRQFLGDCKMPDCDGRMHARPGAEFARCDACGTPVSAEAIRAGLLAELEDRLCTAAEIAHLSTYLGLKDDRERVRKRINQWATRGQIVEHPSISDEATFRFGEVYTKLAATEYAVKPPLAAKAG